MKIKQWANTLINLILLNLLDSLLFYDLFHILISVLLHLKGVMHFLNKVLHMKLPILVGGKCLWKLDARHNIGRHHHSLTLWHLLVSISVIGVRLEWRHQRSFKVKLLSRSLLSLSWCWSRGLRIGLLSDEGRLRLLICIEIEEIEIIFCIVLILGSGMFFQEIEFIPEFMEYICRAMFCARIGAFLLLIDDEISERKHVILLFRLALLAEFKEYWVLTWFRWNTIWLGDSFLDLHLYQVTLRLLFEILEIEILKLLIISGFYSR